MRALLGPESRLLLAAAFLAGGILLALEVVWFRFLLLLMHGTSLAFAIMLAVVLLGIALGGLIGSSWLGLREGAERFAPHLGCLAGVSCLAAWGYGDRLLPFFGYLYFYDALRVFGFTAAVVFPVCVLSGVLFTLLGTLLRRFVADESTATGALTLANTFGAMLDALAGGFLLLPRLGMERSLYLLAALYGLAALLAWLPLARALPARPRGRWGLAAAGVALVTAVATLPLGDPNRYLGVPAQRYASMGEPVVIREGLTDTVTVLRNARWGEPYYHLLLTNGFSMAASTYGGRRYMGLFAYWPAVFRPEPRSALLISYGLGITADALTRVPSLETIDVVDISPDVLAMAPVIFPPPSRTPLEDPRVRVHVEDGRFFLLATDRRFDVITAEPPPPKTAGVVNLYSREYFALVRSRLADSGVATHWLPVDQLYLEENKAVIRAFCDVFEDCSLWTGLLNHWMLVGSRGLPGGLTPETLAQPWRDPGLRAGLLEVGFESPELLAATFLADAGMLRALTAGVEPLTDDHPYRVGPRPLERPSPFYGEFMDPLAARARFAESAAMAGLMDAELRERVLAGYDQHLLWHRTLEVTAGLRAAERFHWLARTLETSALRTPVLVMMDSDARLQALVERAVSRGVDDRELDYQLGVRAMAERDYAEADRLLDRSQPEGPGADPVTYYRALAAHLDGRPGDAEALVERAREALRGAGRSPESVPSGGFWEWWEEARAAPSD